MANSVTKFLTQAAGTLKEVFAVSSSAGAADANKIPALNASGVLDPTILNAKTTSAGAADASKIPQLDSTGRLDLSVMPPGIATDIATLTASEALAAGDFVNIWNNAGAFNVRKADASTSGKEASGYVLSAVAASGSATVYLEGTNTQCTGLAAGVQFLSATTPGKTSTTAPTGSGQIVQRVGCSVSATAMTFVCGDPIILA